MSTGTLVLLELLLVLGLVLVWGGWEIWSLRRERERDRARERAAGKDDGAPPTG